MGVFTPARIPSHAERDAIRRCIRVDIFGLFVVLACCGCRSTGSLPSFFAAADPDSVSSSKRSLPSHSGEDVDLEKLRATAKLRAAVSSIARLDENQKLNQKSNRQTNDTIDQVAATRRSANRCDDDEDHRPSAVVASEADVSEDSQIENATFRDETGPKSPNVAIQAENPRNLPSELAETIQIPTVKIPSEIPGSNAPRIELPQRIHDDDVVGRAQKQEAVSILFPRRPDPKMLELPSDRVMSLDQFESIALDHNPLIAQALAYVTIVEGAAIQAGVSPNPILGWEADTVGSSFSRDYQGIFASQLIKTAGKLPLQRDIANMDLMNAKLAYQRTRNEILHTVRTNYFNVLVAYESMRYSTALVQLGNQVNDAMVARLRGGVTSWYEVTQYEALVGQAVATMGQSQNQYRSAWKQLAASVGIPGLRPAKLEGRADMKVPNFDYDTLLARVMTVHPDLHASKNLEVQAQRNLKLQQVIPIPDVTVSGAFQNDFTTPGYNRLSYNTNVSVPVPIFDRNQGNIRSAQGRLKFSSLQYSVKTNELVTSLSRAFGDYQTARSSAERWKNQILPDLVRAYIGVYDAYLGGIPDADFGAIIVAQQNLAGGVATYVGFLSTQWTTFFDIGNLLQIEDLRELAADLPYGSDQPQQVVPAPASEEGGRP